MTHFVSEGGRPDPAGAASKAELNLEGRGNRVGDSTLAREVAPERGGERLDRYLAAEAAEVGAALSRTRLKNLIEAGAVTIDGAVAADASLAVRPGQRIVVAVPAPADPVPAGEAIPLNVVFEDAHLLVIDKPAGLVVHPAAGHETGTLVNALIAHCGASLSGIGGVRRPGIVHRLDKDTSGLLVVAKTDAAHHGLAALFAEHGAALTREYRALVWAAPTQAQGMVDAPLGRHAIDREKIAVVAAARGRRAVTHWRVLERFGAEACLLACRLETGRTHQIRVHMAHIGHPVIGDPVYAQGFKTKAERLAPQARALAKGLSRQALHAAALGFPHPVTGAPMRFASALPADLAGLCEGLRGGGMYEGSAEKGWGE